jgi:uncharacterized membrane protein
MVNQGTTEFGGIGSTTPGMGGDTGSGIAGGEQARTRIPGLSGLRDIANADRFATGVVGLGLAGFGLARRGPLGIVLGALGVYLLVQTARQKRGATVEAGIEIDETITLDVPRAEVWQSVRRFETWAQFMSHVQEITPTGERRHRWRVDGPAGVPTEWESEVTSEVPEESLSWRTIPGSMVDTEGSLSIENEGAGRTRLRICMRYHPPAGALGHTVAKLFGRDPRTEMRDDLQALKRIIEGDSGGVGTGSTPGVSPAAGMGASKH